MKEFINYGIDLGTTNSCIAKWENDEVKVFQNNSMMNVTPSAIYISRSKRIMIGRNAYDKIISDPENIAVEFKRLMGKKYNHFFSSSNITMSAEDLSAEVLKALIEDVKRQNAEDVKAAVITVPAAFGTLQCEATYRAAQIAGLKKVVLLQEPIAAAVAYGVRPGSKDQNWMVFDLGGGTFDVAIISTYQGRLTVLNHAGDNFLGGKDIDRRIVDKIILPKLKENYVLPDEVDDSSEYQIMYRKLLKQAEDAKIQLSTSSQGIVDMIEIEEDMEGNTFDDIVIQRTELEDVISDIIQRCIDIAEEALEGANISNKNLDKIMLVGGPTQIPFLRQKVSEYFDTEIDYSVDPMTVVARGAAIYASMNEIEQQAKVASINVHQEKLSVKLEYEHITAELESLVIGKFVNYKKGLISDIKIDTADGFWSSGWVPLTDDNIGLFEVNVVLNEGEINNFKLYARDQLGRLLDIDTESVTFSIRQNTDFLEISAPPLPHTLSIEMIDEKGNRRLQSIIGKNTPLPASGNCRCRTNKTLRPNESGEESISIKLWEGENFDDPKANMWLKNIYIKSNEIRRPIPEGAELEIAVNIDQSRRIMVEVYVPHLNEFFVGDAVYNAEPLDIEEPLSIIGTEINEYYNTLSQINESIAENDSIEFRQEYNTVQRELDDFDIEYFNFKSTISSDHDKAAQLVNKAARLRNKLSKLKKKTVVYNSDNKISNEALELLAIAQSAIEKYGSDTEREELKILKSKVARDIEMMDDRALKKGLENLNELRWRVLLRQYEVWQEYFYSLCEREQYFINANEAQYWIQYGLQAERQNNLENLKEAVRHLIALEDKSVSEFLNEKDLPPDLRG